MFGKFITFEGGEGVGKTTQSTLLKEHLIAAGINTIWTREPGGTRGAEAIRGLLMDGSQKLDPTTEALLFAAARVDHVEKLIRPSLNEGTWVVCDRYLDSTRIYQGEVGKVLLQDVTRMEKIATRNAWPDLTIILDLPADIGMCRAFERRKKERPDRFEAEGLDYHNRINDAFRTRARMQPARCVLVNADAEAEVIAAGIWSIVKNRFGIGDLA